ncbi:MAG: MmcQ/YjbR family DNA-binding protein [Planctomycetes bacterium]|nr:MmcQ/YjbR family DNA-binding protein [Planctomycetota bacterium]
MTRHHVPLPAKLRAVEDQLASFAASFPEAREDHPWGHRVYKAKRPIFVFLASDARGLHVTVKLPTSAVAALDRPFCEPTGYGMGRHGWVTASFDERDAAPLELLKAWITESYRAVAPKKLAAVLDGVAEKPKRKRASRATPRSPRR